MEIYEGEWKNNLRHDKKGHGWDFKTKEKYVGGWTKSSKSGKGTMTSEDGSVYTGTFYNDKRHGTGTQIDANGIKHEGDFEKNVKHGMGFEIAKNGKYIKSGIWQGNKYCKTCPVG